MKISVILPAFNERLNLLAIIPEINEVLVGEGFQPSDVEIIVVDDSSSDGTLEALQTLHLKSLQVLSNTYTKGLASSLRCGIEAARGEMILVMDSDYNHDPRQIPALIRALGSEDCVVGSRFLPGGRMAD